MITLKDLLQVIPAANGSARKLAAIVGVAPEISVLHLLEQGVRWRVMNGGIITHVFVLMLENRSYDHIFGFSNFDGVNARTNGQASAEGLPSPLPTNFDPATQLAIEPSSPADFKLFDDDGDPGHGFIDTLVQLCGSKVAPTSGQLPNGKYPCIHNSGFVEDCRNRIGSANPFKCMQVFDPQQLPVLNALANEFAICDHWFSSMPGPTWPNRFFVHAATSGGIDDEVASEAFRYLFDGFSFTNGTIFTRLLEAGKNYMVFSDDTFPVIKGLSDKDFPINDCMFVHPPDPPPFAYSIPMLLGLPVLPEALNNPGFDPSYVFIEPNYGHDISASTYECGNSMHPIDDAGRGEYLIKAVYEAVRNSPLWYSSAIIVVFDEHGGFFDHVPPPSAVPPGDLPTEQNQNQHGFRFDQYGVRVPAVVISPWIAAHTIDHTLFDHASIPATIERLFGLAPLTQRDAKANDLLPLFSLVSPRADAPAVLPSPAPTGFTCDGDDVVPSTAQKARTRIVKSANDPISSDVAQQLFLAARKHLALVPSTEREAVVQRYSNIKTIADADQYLGEVRALIKASPLPQRPH
jgi:phospholipase C